MNIKVNTVAMPPLSESDKARLWSKVGFTENTDDCWVWTENVNTKAPYAKLTVIVNKVPHHISAHRLAYFVHYNNDPVGKVVCHKCDNPKCCNPHHLFLGTHSDNSKDMIAKGRGGGQFGDGEKHWNCRLTENEVSSIRQEVLKGVSQKDLSLKYNIHQSAISRIVNNKRRKNIFSLKT